MIISPENLDQHLSLMTSFATPISIDDWVIQKQQASLKDKLYFAITFDDGWQDNYSFALPILQKYKIPSTVFLVTKLINTDLNFWPNRLGQLLSNIHQLRPELLTDSNLEEYCGPITPYTSLQAMIDTAINTAKRHSDADTHHFIDSFYSQHSELTEEKQRSLLNLSEIEELHQKTGATFGSHTQTHCRLHSTLQPKHMQSEVLSSKQDLHSLTEHISTTFCYPNGDISSDAENLVQQHYQAACTTAQGINPQDCNPFKLKRFNLHNGNAGSKARLLSSLLNNSESAYY